MIAVAPLKRISQASGVPVHHIIGPVVGVLTGLAVVAPRSAWWLAIAFVLLFMAASVNPKQSLLRALQPAPATLALLLLALWAMLSTAWAIVPTDGVLKGLLLAGMALAVTAAVRLGADLDEMAWSGLAIGLLAAMCVTGTYLAFDLWTDQALGRRLLNTFPALLDLFRKHVVLTGGKVTLIDDAEINRRVAVWTLLLWPCLASIGALISRRARWLVALVLLVQAAAIMVGTGHQSSQLAFVLGGAVYGLHLVSAWLARRVLLAAWCVAVFLAVPIAAVSYDLGLSRSEWLFASARDRVALWAFAARNVMERPLLGAGANATPQINTAIAVSKSTEPRIREHADRPGRHSHNFYIQTWYELGVIGAMLLFTIGLAAQRAIWLLQPQVQGQQLANLTTIAAMVASSYGMWQPWFQGALAASVILMTVAGLRSDRR